jgi:hypothetical protein
MGRIQVVAGQQRDVLVAAVTVPTAPRLKATVLAEGNVALNPVPVITSVGALIARFVEEDVLFTVGAATIVLTCTAAPLVAPLAVTTAVRAPSEAGGVVKETVSDVLVAAVTVPTAPRLNCTELAAAFVLNPEPAITICAALAESEVLLVVTLGAATTVAT